MSFRNMPQSLMLIMCGVGGVHRVSIHAPCSAIVNRTEVCRPPSLTESSKRRASVPAAFQWFSLGTTVYCVRTVRRQYPSSTGLSLADHVRYLTVSQHVLSPSRVGRCLPWANRTESNGSKRLASVPAAFQYFCPSLGPAQTSLRRANGSHAVLDAYCSSDESRHRSTCARSHTRLRPIERSPMARNVSPQALRRSNISHAVSIAYGVRTVCTQYPRSTDQSRTYHVAAVPAPAVRLVLGLSLCSQFDGLA